MAYLLLEGGSEFGGRMSEPDLRALELAGGLDAQIAILPTAAAQDNNHERAGKNGQRWFRSLGASRIDAVPVIDRQSADDPGLAARVRAAHLIYLLGGFPRYLCEVLRDSEVWDAALDVYRNRGVIAGSSAGAMVLCEHYYDPYEEMLLAGLGLLVNVCVLPHHNRFGKSWAPKLLRLLPQIALLGIDEHTGMINDGADGAWTVYGAGAVTLYRAGQVEIHARGKQFRL
jgi:cyanophycinase